MVTKNNDIWKSVQYQTNSRGRSLGLGLAFSTSVGCNNHAVELPSYSPQIELSVTAD